MTYHTAKYLEFKEQPFSGGVVDNVQPNILAESQSPYLRNARLDGYGVVIRPGKKQIATTGGTNIGGMGLYNQNSGTSILARADVDSTHKLVSIDSVSHTVTPITTGSQIASENQMHFTQGGDKVYCFDGSSPMGIWDGTTYTSKTVTSQSPSGSLVNHLVFGTGSITFSAYIGITVNSTFPATFTAGNAYITTGTTSYVTVGQTVLFPISIGNITANTIYTVAGTGVNISGGYYFDVTLGGTLVTPTVNGFQTADIVTVTGGTSIGTGTTQLQVGDTIYFTTVLGNLQQNNVYQVLSSAGSSPNYTATITTYPLTGSAITPTGTGVITATVSNRLNTTNIITSVDVSNIVTNHGLHINDSIQFVNAGIATDGASTNVVPSPLVAGTTYYVVAVPTSHTFQVSATVGGGAITFTDDGSPINTNKFNLVFTPAFSVIFNGAQFAAGSPVFSNYVFQSSAAGLYDTFNFGGNQYAFNEPVTGLATTSETLFYFTKNNVFTSGLNDVSTVNGVSSYIQRASQAYEGAINNASIVPAGVECYYLTPSNKIFMMQRARSVIYGFEATIVSHRKYKGISKFMDSLPTQQTQSVGYYVPDKQIIKWFLRTYDAPVGVNNVCVVYDINKDAFLIDTNISFIGATYGNDTAYTLDKYNGIVYQDETGRNDNGFPIPFFYATKHFDAGAPSMKKEFWEARTFANINDQVDLVVKTYVDGNLVNEKRIFNGDGEVLFLDVNGNVVTDVNGDEISFLVYEQHIADTNGGIGVPSIGGYPIGTETPTESNQDITIVASKGDLRKRGRYIQITYENKSRNPVLELQNLMIRSETLPPETLNRTDGF